jgi:hypothetical protein
MIVYLVFLMLGIYCNDDVFKDMGIDTYKLEVDEKSPQSNIV